MTLARKITLYVLLFSGLFTLLGTGFQLYRDYQQGVSGLEETLSLIEKSHISSLSQNVWYLDESNVETQLFEIMSLPSVAHLKLEIPNFGVTEKGVLPEEHLLITRPFELSFSSKPSQKATTIGHLTVSITLEELYESLQDRLVIILFTQAIQILFVSLFIVFLFYQLVTKHLQKISAFMANSTVETLAEPLRLEQGDALFRQEDANDELTVLVSSINAMRSELCDEIKAKQAREKQLQQEVKDRRRAEKVAQESEAHLKSVVEALPDLIWLKDPDGIYISCNPKFERFFGVPETEIIGKTDYDFAETKMADFLRANDLTAIKTGQPHLNEEEITYADDGHKELIETVKTPMFSADGELIGVLGVGRDITQRRIAEQGLRRAQKMDAVGQLTGGIAHDFNNILGIIQGNLELLKLVVSIDQRADKYFSAIQKSTQRAVDLTRQLLGFSRRQPAQIIVTDIGALMGDMASLIQRSVTPKIKVMQHAADHLWVTEIDPGDFEDALLNLILNARDAMPNGGQLTLEATNAILDETFCAQNPGIIPGKYVQLTVNDSGLGIPDVELERIFEPFYTTKPQGKGTGLGLAMVFGFVNRSHGHIRVYSEQGLGTSFKIYLPRATGPITPLVSSSELPTSELPTGSETLLIVDDEPDLLEFAETALLNLGYRVFKAESGQEALTVLSKESIDLLFSDVVMPGGMSGYELAEQACDLYPQLSVLLTSGYTEKVVSRSEQSKLTHPLLSKPYSQIILAQRVRNALDNRLETDQL